MNSENNYSISNDNHFFNINSLVNIYKDNNEFLTNLCNNNGTNFILSEDNTMSIINQILTSNNRIYNNIINMMNNNNNNSRSNNSNNYNTRNTNRNVRGLNRDIRNTNIDRNISFRNNRVYIDNIPYIIDNIETYSIQNNTPNSNLHHLRDFFEPVEIFPTQSQIENATRIVRYCDIVRPLNTSCPISLERFNDNDRVTIIRYCGHIFNGNELNNWFRTNCRCPVCRYDIRNYNQSNNINNLFNEVNENNTDNTNNTNTDNTNNNSTNTNSTNNTNNINGTSTTENINSNTTSQDNLPNNNSSINNVERNPINNSNSNLIRQMVQNIVNELDSNLLNQNEQNRLEQIFYTISTDISGNIPYNALNYLWDTYRNNST